MLRHQHTVKGMLHICAVQSDCISLDIHKQSFLSHQVIACEMAWCAGFSILHTSTNNTDLVLIW